ncbi:MAG: cobalamin biosynthesis protein [Acidilobaceae archaeon]|nr:cobalamin biosynthesis protein [Acidilobaceae archaeon]MCX8165844.1 cobalamin biosynthesis protein [Acidilobaceae archaeon]MDW7974852.1 cobalamin biosynthesis protein [Sulfolobales archaeon]
MLEPLWPEPWMIISALAIALLLDLIYPEHRGVWLLVHPVRTSYFMALRLAKPYGSRALGAAVWLVVMVSHLLPAALLLYLSYHLHPLLWALSASAVLKFSAALRLLLDICEGARREMRRGNLEGARGYVQMIVRRDTKLLGEPHLASACIESTAESLVDGFTSPLFYFLLLGPLGALAQRVANTLDGAVGFKTPEYARVGWFSAKADTLLNFLPARLTALLIALSAPAGGGSTLGAVRCWLSDRDRTESLNAGHPMSAMAGALGVWLEKKGHYKINEGGRPPGAEDIARAQKITLVSAVLAVAAAIFLLLL